MNVPTRCPHLFRCLPFIFAFLSTCCSYFSLQAEQPRLSKKEIGQFLSNLPSCEIYQDIYIQGRVVKRGIRSCKSRYEAIRKFCQKYKRPITVLDIGANFGYFSFRLSEDFPGTYVMIEGGESESKILAQLCEYNSSRGNMIMLKKKLTLKDLQNLAEVEHFDVVLALSIIHHFNEPLPEVLKTMASLGDNLLIEIPHKGENACNQERIQQETLDLSNYTSQILAVTSTHTAENKLRNLYAVKCPKKTVTKPYWETLPAKFEPPVITSTFKKKTVSFPHKGEPERKWKHGITFSTFLALNGVFPAKDSILNMMRAIDPTKNDDIRPWNFILNGSKLQPIDYYNIPRSTAYGKTLERMISLYEQGILSPNSSEQFF